MRKSTRAILGLILLDSLLVAGAGWMVLQVRNGEWQSPDPAEAIRRITEVAGGAIGIVTVVLLIAFVVHRARGN